MKFLVPTGIGDSVWALHKVQAIARAKGEERIDILLQYGDTTAIQKRGLDFVRRFSFVNSVDRRAYELVVPPGVTPDGYFHYILDGMYDFKGEQCCVLIPNAALERGHRLESWLPEYEINWNIWKDFQISTIERIGAHMKVPKEPYAVFYPGPMHGNTVAGHNRGSMWSPADWLKLGQRIHRELGLKIVVVGAPYDAQYYDVMVQPLLNGDQSYWTNLIGRTNLGELWTVTSGARFVISYQAGVGIVSTYLGTPTAIFWRPKGNSIIPDGYLSFEEEMASAWVPPEILKSGTHMPLIYGRHGIDYIMDEIQRRHWV